MHLHEQKVATLSEAAVLADEYVLTHRTVFSAVRQTQGVRGSTERNSVIVRSLKPEARVSASAGGAPKRTESRRVCFYCLDPNHFIADCKAWKQKGGASKTKSVAHVTFEL